MTANLKIKPTKIWPIWVFYGIFFVVGIFNGDDPRAAANLIVTLLWVAIILSVIIHLRNKKNFGKTYLNKPKPTKEIIEKSKYITFVPSKTHQTINYTLTFISFAIGLFVGGLLAGVLLGLGINLLFDTLIRFTNSIRNSKVLISLILGIIFIAGGGWFAYNSLISTIDSITEEYMLFCDTSCENSDEVNDYLYTQYFVEYDRQSKSFVCNCLTDTEDVLAKIYLPLN